MAKKNFKGVPDDYATNPYPGWGVPLPQEAIGICDICGVNHGELEHKPYKPDTNPMSLKDIDKLLKDTYGKSYYVPPVDPVLIKASSKPNFFDNSPSPIVEPMPVKQMRVEIRPEIPGYSSQKNGFKKHGFAWTLSGWQDITESQLRKMLMDGFMKITDDIVNQIKEQNK